MTAPGPGNLWSAYVKGWSCGAKAAEPYPTLEHHAVAEIRAAHMRGYEAGRDARRIASQDAAMIYGYTPTILRVQSDRSTR